MKRFPMLLAATIAAFPLLVAAQTANQPGGQASTGTPLDQTNKPENTTPKTTSTSPDANNPAGSLPAKPKHHATKKATTQTGDVPTYPAPAPDGTPTK
jgi:hypothetical protein